VLTGAVVGATWFATAAGADPTPGLDGTTSSGPGSWPPAPGEEYADLAAIGGTVKGRAGDVVSLTIGVKNVGNTTLVVPNEDAPEVGFDVTLPAGTSATVVPNICQKEVKPDSTVKPGSTTVPVPTYRPRYPCSFSTSEVERGEELAATFRVKIDRELAGPAGSVVLKFPDDSHRANDTAKITVVIGDPDGGGVPPAALVGIGGACLVAGAAALAYARRRRASSR
jgi:hypothetical protein